MKRFVEGMRPFFILFVAIMAVARALREFNVSPAVIMLLLGVSLGCLLGGLLSVAMSANKRAQAHN